MTADLMVVTLLRAQVVAGAAILMVLAIRGPARRLIGAGMSYGLWALAPIAAVASLFPTLSEFISDWANLPAGPLAWTVRPVPHAAWVLSAWGVGAATMAVLLAVSEARFRRSARQGRAGPAVMGIYWPRMIVPSDYAERFDAPERDLIRQHERAHIARRDPQANLIAAVVLVLGWCNPLVHLAVAAARLDQELACDASVLERRPESRRRYGETLLKAHLAAPRSPFACAWSPTSAHPLDLRIRMLSRSPPSLLRYMAGAALLIGLGLATAVAVWGLTPQGATVDRFHWSNPSQPAVVDVLTAPFAAYTLPPPGR